MNQNNLQIPDPDTSDLREPWSVGGKLEDEERKE